MKKILPKFAVVGLFLFLGIIPFIWLRKPGYMINGVDTNFPLDPLSWFLQRFYVWNPTINGGVDWSSSVSAFFFHGIQAFFYSVGFSVIATEKITLIFWLLLLGFSIYYLFSTIQELYLKETSKLAIYLARITAVIFYVFNLYQMDVWKNVKVANLMLLIAGPLALAVVIKLLHRKITFPAANVMFIGIMLICAGMGLNPAYFLIFLFTLISWLVWYTFADKIYVRKDRKQQLFYALGGLLCIGIVSSFWLLPLLANMLGITGEKIVSLKDLGVQNWLDGLSKNTSIFTVLRLQGAWDWYENGLQNVPYVSFARTYFSHPFFIFYSLLIPLLAFTGFYYYRKQYIAYYFSFILIVGLIFSTGTHPPFGTFYLFLNKYLPFFSFFRSPWYIFTFLTVLGYVVLISLFVQKTVGRYQRKAGFSVILLLIGNLIYSFPMIRGDIFRPYQTLGTYYVNIPEYVYDFGNYMKMYPPQGNILVSPQVSAENYDWGYSGVTPLVSLVSNAPVIFPEYGQKQIGTVALMSEKLEKELLVKNTKVAKNIFGTLGIAAVLNRKDLYDRKPLSEDSFSSDIFDTSRTKAFGEWMYYPVRQDLVRPLFWIPNQKVMVDGDVAKYPALGSLATFDPKAEITFTTGVKTVNQRQIPAQEYNTAYIVPNCLFCEGFSHEYFALPFVRILPGSIFYKYIQWKEAKEAKMYPGLSQADFKFHLADKRLAEIRSFIERKEERGELFAETLDRFDSEIQEAIYVIKKAEANGENTYVSWENVFEHLSVFSMYFHTFLQNKLSGGIIEEIEHARLLVEERKKDIQKSMWYPENLQVKKLTFSIPFEGEYQLLYRQNNGIKKYYQQDQSLSSTIFIDGSEATPSADIKNGEWLGKGSYTFKQGIHKIEIQTPKLTNLVDSNKSTISLATNTTMEILRLPLKELLPRYVYRLSFQYRTVRGIPPRFAIDYDGGRNIKQLKSQVLDSSTTWQTYSQFIVPENPLTNAEVVLAAHPYNNDAGTVVEFKDMTLYIDQSPEIVWYRENKQKSSIKKPLLTIKQLNPVEYKVLVKQASEPFTLIFNQNFQKGWQVIIDGEKVDSSKHFLVNGYANGWDIDKKGDYEIRVVYAPQQLFLAGFTVTAIIILVSIVGYVLRKKKNKI